MCLGLGKATSGPLLGRGRPQKKCEAMGDGLFEGDDVWGKPKGNPDLPDL
jgi:hypothetical protein